MENKAPACRYHECKSENTEWQSVENRRIKCRDCGKSTTLPKEENKYKRPASHRNLVKKSGITYCQKCRIPEDKLPYPQKLVAHHVIPYKEEKEYDPKNIWIVCSECHAEIEHTIIYKGHWIKQNPA